MKRRDLATAAAGSAALTLSSPASADGGWEGSESKLALEGGKRFRMKFAPHVGQLRHLAGGGYLKQLAFAAEVGFTAWEDNGMMGRPGREQERAAEVMNERGLTMGAFVGYASYHQALFARPDRHARMLLKRRMLRIIECAKRVNAKWTAVVPGTTGSDLAWDQQTANVIETLKMCAEMLEPEGVVMVLEPLSHPRCFLTGVAQAYQICRAVGSPSCKILNDLYHQHLTEGNLIATLESAWSEIAYLQTGDYPGRTEPGSGEINYRDIFKYLQKKGFDGVIGMEHGNSREGKAGEVRLVQAYREADDF